MTSRQRIMTIMLASATLLSFAHNEVRGQLTRLDTNRFTATAASYLLHEIYEGTISQNKEVKANIKVYNTYLAYLRDIAEVRSDVMVKWIPSAYPDFQFPDINGEKIKPTNAVSFDDAVGPQASYRDQRSKLSHNTYTQKSLLEKSHIENPYNPVNPIHDVVKAVEDVLAPVVDPVRMDPSAFAIVKDNGATKRFIVDPTLYAQKSSDGKSLLVNEDSKAFLASISDLAKAYKEFAAEVVDTNNKKAIIEAKLPTARDNLAKKAEDLGFSVERAADGTFLAIRSTKTLPDTLLGSHIKHLEDLRKQVLVPASLSIPTGPGTPTSPPSSASASTISTVGPSTTATTGDTIKLTYKVEPRLTYGGGVSASPEVDFDKGAAHTVPLPITATSDYVIEFSSKNNFHMVHENDISQKIQYNLDVDGSTLPTATQVPDTNSTKTRHHTMAKNDHKLTFTHPQHRQDAGLLAGQYSDTVTIIMKPHSI